MNKNKFALDFLPFNHFLIGFCYQSGVLSENTSISFDEFSLGLGLINFTYTRTYNVQ